MMKLKSFLKIGLVAAMAAAAITFVSGHAWAQGAQRLPLEKAVMTGEPAKRTLVNNQIASEIAQQIVDACVAAAKAVNGSVSVFVIAPDGEIVASRRMDGQNTVNTQTGLRKAQTALYLRESTGSAVNRFATLDSKIIRQDLDMYLVRGGLPIIVDDVMIGAIGVGGGQNIQDEACAHQALTKVLGPQPPVAPAMPPNPLGNAAPGGGGRGGAGGGGAGGGRGGGGN